MPSEGQQQQAMGELAKKLGFEILSTPTGQGIVIRLGELGVSDAPP